MNTVSKTALCFSLYAGLLLSAYASISDEEDWEKESLESQGFSEANFDIKSVSSQGFSEASRRSDARSILSQGFTADTWDTASNFGESRIEKRGQKLNQIYTLKSAFKKGFLEITPASYKGILEHTLLYGTAFETYDRGVSLKGWSEKEDVKGLLKLLHYFNAVKSVKCRKNAWEGKVFFNTLSDAIQHYESLENLDLKDSGLKDKETLKLLKVLPNPASLKLLNMKASVLSSHAQSEIKENCPNLIKMIVGTETKDPLLKPESKAVKDAASLAAVIKTEEQKTPSSTPHPPATASGSQAPVLNTAIPNIIPTQDDKSQALARSQPLQKVTNEDIFDALKEVKQKSLYIEAFAALLKSDPSFSSLDLSGGNGPKISPEDVMDLAQVLQGNTSLKVLSLDTKAIGDAGGKALAQALQGNASLQTLNLGDNNIGVEGGKALAQALKGNTSLTLLNLGDNTIGVEGGKALAQALKGNTSLQILWLDSNTIGVEGGKALAQALQGNTSLQTLGLGGNNIGDEGVKALAQALQGNTSLNNLDLRWNNIGDEGGKALAQALQGNTSLTVLWFGGNAIGEEGKGILQKLEQSNPTLEIYF